MTVPNVLEQIITRHPFLEGLAPEFLPAFFESATLQPIERGRLVFGEGQPAEKFYLVHSGQIALETSAPGRGPLTMQTLTGGEALGWSWMFAPYIWHFSARATEPSELIVLPAAALREKADKNARFGREIALRVSKILLDRLQATRMQLIDFYAPVD